MNIKVYNTPVTDSRRGCGYIIILLCRRPMQLFFFLFAYNILFILLYYIPRAVSFFFFFFFYYTSSSEGVSYAKTDVPARSRPSTACRHPTEHMRAYILLWRRSVFKGCKVSSSPYHHMHYIYNILYYIPGTRLGKKIIIIIWEYYCEKSISIPRCYCKL